MLFLAALAGCVDDSATPIDPSDPGATEGTVDFTDVTHTVEPTAEMKAAAEQQCLDDPAASEGYVRAVDPSSGDILAEYSVDCGDVRG